MKSEDPKHVEVEILPREDNSVSVKEPSSISVSHLFHEHLLTCPPIRPISPMILTREDLEAPFPHRFGMAVILAFRSAEYSISPDGTLRAFLRLFMRWFLALLLVVVVIGVPLLIAGQFIDQVAALLESAMKHLFWACVWLAGAVCVLAALIAGVTVVKGED